MSYDKKKLYNKEWAAKNKERRALYRKSYYEANKERLKKYSADYKLKHGQNNKEARTAWRSANIKKARALTARWQIRNRGRCNAISRRYDASKLRATPVWSEKEKIVCLYEKASVLGMHVDHIVPLQSALVCGLHVFANLQLLPPIINTTKKNRWWPDMP